MLKFPAICQRKSNPGMRTTSTAWLVELRSRVARGQAQLEDVSFYSLVQLALKEFSHGLPRNSVKVADTSPIASTRIGDKVRHT